MATDSEKSFIDVLHMVGEVVTTWPGVTSHPHRFGGTEFRVGIREMGHMHGSKLADFPFPMNLRDQLIKEGKVVPHHVLPNSGWVSFWINGKADVEPVVALFRMQYERLRRK